MRHCIGIAGFEEGSGPAGKAMASGADVNCIKSNMVQRSTKQGVG